MVAVTIFLGIVIASMFKQFWFFLFKMLFVAIQAVKWLIILGIIVGFTSSRQFYDWVGWSPASAIYGKEIYEKKPTADTSSSSAANY